jgi:glucose/arabinose dehydrogenase
MLSKRRNFRLRDHAWVLLLAVAPCAGCGATDTKRDAIAGSGDGGSPSSDASAQRDASSSGDASAHGDASAQSDASTQSDASARSDAGPSGAADGGGTSNGAACTGTVHSTAAAAKNLPAPPAVTLPTGFAIETIAAISQARELAALPNGDLLVGTQGLNVVLVPNADSTAAPGAPVTFATTSDGPAQGVAFDPASCTVFVATTSSVYAMAYADAQTTATPGTPIAKVRQGPISPNRASTDTDNHMTSSVAFAGGKLYVSAGSSCNSCTEVDPTRAAIQVMDPTGANMQVRATRIRNALALAVNPATGSLWAGGAGQDFLAEGHPYEFFDPVTSHSGVADYGWPECEEDHVAYGAGTDAGCANTVEPRIELPAYSTIIGATFYPSAATGAHAFPAGYRGGVFLSAHGSWHVSGTAYYSAPIVVFVAMNGDTPQIAVNWAMTVDWNDSAKQWTDFVTGFQESDGMTRIGRPTGIAVGAQGSLLIADDQNGAVYRIRPN